MRAYVVILVFGCVCWMCGPTAWSAQRPKYQPQKTFEKDCSKFVAIRGAALKDAVKYCEDENPGKKCEVWNYNDYYPMAIPDSSASAYAARLEEFSAGFVVDEQNYFPAFNDDAEDFYDHCPRAPIFRELNAQADQIVGACADFDTARSKAIAEVLVTCKAKTGFECKLIDPNAFFPHADKASEVQGVRARREKKGKFSAFSIASQNHYKLCPNLNYVSGASYPRSVSSSSARTTLPSGGATRTSGD